MAGPAFGAALRAKLPVKDGDGTATGFADVTSCDNRVRNAGIKQFESRPAGATHREWIDGSGLVASLGPATTQDSFLPRRATTCGNSPARIRTGDRAIMSRQL